MTWQNYLFSPHAFFADLSRKPPFGWSLLAWLVSVMLLVGAQEVRSRLHGQAHSRSHFSRGPSVFAIAMAGCLLVLPLAGFLSFALLWMVHSPVRLEQIISGITAASVPAFLGLLLEILRDLEWRLNLPGRALYTLCTLWAGVLLWIGFRQMGPIGGWQAFTGMLPEVLLCGAIGISIWRSRPDTLRALYPWRMRKGRRVRVYYPPGTPEAEIREIIQGCDAVLEQAEDLLRMPPLPFPVGVYLFPDSKTHRKALDREKDHGAKALGYAHDDAISLPYASWSSIKSTVAHEFGHVLLHQHVTTKLHGLLNEGLACYLGVRVGGRMRQEIPPVYATWRTLAHRSLFYEWLYVEQSEYPSEMLYAYATTVATFLIERYGLPAYLRLCREAACEEEIQSGEKLAKAAEAVYGKSLETLEKEWRFWNLQPELPFKLWE